MELDDLIPISEWEKIANDIHNRFGFNGTVYKSDNFILSKSTSPANNLCPVIKGSKDGVIICSSAQQRLSKIARDSNKLAIGECDAGFTKFVIPIFVNGKFLGMIGGCGCLIDQSSVDSFYVAKLLGKDEKDIKDLSENTPRLTSDELSEAISYTQEHLKRILKNNT
ncbi:MAG: PocR ligand-binding domain-containing protein [Nitrospirae bacterium]|nr:PocR ligand-binding domain-containing protein [Nitrospirota bacterium]